MLILKVSIINKYALPEQEVQFIATELATLQRSAVIMEEPLRGIAPPVLAFVACSLYLTRGPPLIRIEPTFKILLTLILTARSVDFSTP